MKILIVEDNMILCGMIEKWLQKAGYEVLTAIDELGAGSILKKNEINLVLGDVRLLEGDGISLLEWMMRSKMEVPFIVMTDYEWIIIGEYLSHPDREDLYKEFSTFKDKRYRYLRCGQLLHDSETNEVYLSPWLKDKKEGHPEFYQRLTNLLKGCGIEPIELKCTKDYWARDLCLFS